MLKNYHQHLYFFGLVLLVISLPLSIFLLSVALFILIINWLLENNYKEKWKLAKSRKSIFAFLIFYLVHVIGLFYSSDWIYGIHDLKIKLPLLILPVVIGTSKSLPSKKFYYILYAFCGAVFLSTLISAGKLFGWWGAPVMDVRDISIFISHIRLALMINMAIFILLWLIEKNEFIVKQAGIFVLVLWLIFFLVLLKSLTGVIILIVLILYFSIRWLFRNYNLMAKWFIAVGLVSLMLIVTAYITNSIGRFYHVDKIVPSELDSTTVNGNIYAHDIHSRDFENGSYTWLYVCDKELEKSWNSRSKLNYKGTDLKGQELRYTVIRYLTSKGLRKDSAGISRLQQSDIKNIERGMANYIYSWKFRFYPRIYQLLWEVNQYKNGGYPSGHSFTQRIEYLKTARHIIKSNFWIGVGTGDVAKAFKEQYEKDQSKLDLRWRLRAHNQFITFFLTFGVFGFIIITAALIYPVFYEKKWNSYLVPLFLIVGFLSFLNEDTLETHAGITFFAFFYAFFLYYKDNNDKARR